MNTRMTGVRAAALLLAASPLLPVSAATSAQAVPECGNADLTASYHRTDAAMSHYYGHIALKNTSNHACSTGGYGGLSYVGGGNGTQVGAAADRVPATVRFYVLQPGQAVHQRVVETSFAPYPKAKCRPRHVDGFRVYVPDSTASQFIAHPTTGCANPAVHLLTHKPYRR